MRRNNDKTGIDCWLKNQEIANNRALQQRYDYHSCDFISRKPGLTNGNQLAIYATLNYDGENGLYYEIVETLKKLICK